MKYCCIFIISHILILDSFRYASISSYLSECSQKYNYNDIPLVCDEKSYNRLRERGINEAMAKHISHLFIR